MIIATTETIPGKTLEYLGFVEGATVQSKNIGKDIGASFKTLVGGEIKGYAEMLEDARFVAMERMREQAEKLQADAVVAMRFGTSSVMQGAAEILAYGTAVRFV